MTPDERAALTTKLRGGVAGRTKGIAVDRSTRVLAVASGKGGVGKSTLTTNLAAAFSSLDYRTGVLDADIYGYSIPHLLGITQRPVAVDDMIVPPVRNGLKLMSIGFFLDDNAPVMWRGPMLHRALEQFLSDVHWGELDVLLVDMPPGTGDVAISLGQLLPRAEAIVVTTPQPLAQDVAARAALMAQKTNMRLLGVVENMSSEVFGSGGGAQLAESLGTALLGTVPLDAALREAADAGEPLVWSDPDADCEPRDRRGRRSSARSRARARRRHHEGAAPRRLSECDTSSGSAASASPKRTRQCSPTTFSTPSGAASSGTASRGSTGWRRSTGSIRRRGRSSSTSEPRLRALGRARRARVPHAGGDLRLAARRTAGARPRRRGGELLSRRGCSATGCGGWRTAASSPR